MFSATPTRTVPSSHEDPGWERTSGVSERFDSTGGLELPGVRIERIIAAGGVGIVYAARDEETGERMALKVLDPRYAFDRGMQARFDREIAFTALMHHPNVVELTSSGVLADGRPFLRMPLYEGRTLGAEVRARGPLTIDRALEVGEQLLGGLSALHEARVVHRDLQPENVFLGSEGGDLRVKVLDLGFASKPGVDLGDGVSSDSPGALVGTLAFLSPEQATRGRAIREASDLFGAALLLHYALTGKVPFRGHGGMGVAVAVVRDAPVPLRRERRDAPAALEAVIARGLAKHPDDRFESASAMRSAVLAASR